MPSPRVSSLGGWEANSSFSLVSTGPGTIVIKDNFVLLAFELRMCKLNNIFTLIWKLLNKHVYHV